jgi:hypothetical protein
MHRVLAVLIALLLGGGVVTAVVKGGDDDTVPVVEPTPSPTQTFTFDGAVPTESQFTETASPFEPSTESPTVEPTETATETMDELPRTGAGSLAPAALVTLAIALGAGVAVTRAARTSE